MADHVDRFLTEYSARYIETVQKEGLDSEATKLDRETFYILLQRLNQAHDRQQHSRRYSQDLQRIIEHLCRGELVPESELQTTARHHWEMAKKYLGK